MGNCELITCSVLLDTSPAKVGGEVEFCATSSNADVLKLKPSDGNIPQLRINCEFNISHEQVYGAAVRAKLKNRFTAFI